MDGKNKIFLTEDLFIGGGAHKLTYVHPLDNGLCVKILKQTPDVDLDRELAYRKSRVRRNLSSAMLTKYLGTVPTNLGIGYVFERVCDYDGSTSLNLQEFIESKDLDEQHIMDITSVLFLFKELYFKEKVITSNMEYENFLVQKISPESYTIRIIDNIGSPVLIPLVFYIDTLANKRLKKYWQRLIEMLKQQYPMLMNDELVAKLR